MDVWQIVLYGFGAFLAFRTLAGLMEAHRQQTLHELTAKHIEKENQRRLAEREAKKSAAEDGEKGRVTGERGGVSPPVFHHADT